MIGQLRGTLLEKQPPTLLLDVGGVGYELQAPMTSFYPLPDIGKQTILYTHLSVSENAHQLFGFYTEDERRLFRTLIKVNGVGPKMALAILSGITVSEFVNVVMADNSAALVKIPGVGKKTAERLIIEVKDKLQDWAVSEKSIIAPQDSNLISGNSSMIVDAESALIALGYKPADASKVIAAIQKNAEPTNSEELIRLALKSMAS